jgi:hypothetical protein
MSLMAMGDAAVLTKRNKYFDVLDFIKAWNFNKSLADDIQKFFAYQIAKDDLGGQQEEEIFQQIPRLLQIDVTRQMLRQQLQVCCVCCLTKPVLGFGHVTGSTSTVVLYVRHYLRFNLLQEERKRMTRSQSFLTRRRSHRGWG